MNDLLNAFFGTVPVPCWFVLFLLFLVLRLSVTIRRLQREPSHKHDWNKWSEVKCKRMFHAPGPAYDNEEETSGFNYYYQTRTCKTCEKYEEQRVDK